MTLPMIPFCFELPALFEIKALTVKRKPQTQSLKILDRRSGVESVKCIFYVQLSSQAVKQVDMIKDYVFDDFD